MTDYDVVVVGAGPAGTTAAYNFAEAGLKTLLLEKFSLPRDKPCGGAVMYRAIAILKGDIPYSIIERKIYGLCFALPNTGDIEFVSDKLIGITVHRSKFDEYLAHRAVDRGAELWERARVIDAKIKDNNTVVTLSDGREISSRFLIGADGVNSVISRKLGLRPERKDPTKVGLGMESDFYVGRKGVMEATNGYPHMLEISPAGNRVSYGWVFPKREHLAIGVAGAAFHMHPLTPLFEDFRKGMEKKLGVELVPEKRRTYFLGGDGLRSKNVHDRTILVGDAAGFVDPMMGEGIAYAMQSSVLASKLVIEGIEEDRYDEEYLSVYHDMCHEEFGANFEMALWAGLKGTSFAESLLPRAKGHKLAADIMAKIARGEIGYADIPFTVVKSLPKELPRIIRQIVQSKIE